MLAAPVFSLEECQKLRAEALEHERQAAILNKRAYAMEQYLATFGADEREPNVGHPISRPNETDGNFMGTIRRLANSAKSPIPKAEMKELLLKEGFPAKQVRGTYFYVALKKLSAENKGQISIKDDGSIWKGKTP